jgi:hypothetical protein
MEYENGTIFDVLNFGKDVAEVVEMESNFIGEYSTNISVCEQVKEECSGRTPLMEDRKTYRVESISYRPLLFSVMSSSCDSASSAFRSSWYTLTISSSSACQLIFFFKTSFSDTIIAKFDLRSRARPRL